MKPIMGVVLSGHSKDYALPKFLEMIYSYDIDVVFATDEHRDDLQHNKQIIVPDMHGAIWATEIVCYGRWAINTFALERDYTHMIWQGVDCYYAQPGDLQKLLHFANDYDIVGGLIAGRNRADYPVCRNYVKVFDVYTEQVSEIDPEILGRGNLLTISGYIGSDATVISRHAMKNVSMDGYVHWHERRDIPGAFGPEEYFMWSALQYNEIYPRVHTGVRPWHAHEDGVTVRYPGEVCDLQSLTF